MKLPQQKIHDILLKGKYLSPEDLAEAEKLAEKNNIDLQEVLFTEDYVTKDLLGQAIAEDFGVPYADLNSHSPGKSQVLKISEEIARKHSVVIFKETDDKVILTTSNPRSKQMLEDLQDYFNEKDPKILDKKFSISYSLDEDIEDVFMNYRKELETRFEKIIEKSETVAPNLVEEILKDAYSLKASDVHFEPTPSEVVIRFRVDGRLQRVGKIDHNIYENVLNRIKVWGGMRIDEHFAAQDGAIRHETDEKSIDLRVSVAPIVDGEKIAIRILSQYTKGFDLGDLGLSDDGREKVQSTANKPFGMIIVSGPTGSGKTTTLYAVLKEVTNPEVNVTTIEDPVEYRIQGVNQIQVNKETKLTFARGLRSIVRQDPDVILVGEIRDIETAEISVNASLTGHLLLSTFHANDAATTIPRLMDMGVEPFLLSSTLNMVVSQRLIRRICDSCRYSKAVKSEEIRKKIGKAEFCKDKTCTLYEGKGCPECNDTGFKGRTAVFEIITIDDEMRELILKNPSSQQIWELARKKGSKSMFENGLSRVENGVTTLDELLRVANPPSELMEKK